MLHFWKIVLDLRKYRSPQVPPAGLHKDGTGVDQRFSWGTLTIEAGFGYSTSG